MANDVVEGVSDFDFLLESGPTSQEIIPEHGLCCVASVKHEHLLDRVFNRRELAEYGLAGASGNVGGPGVLGAIAEVC